MLATRVTVAKSDPRVTFFRREAAVYLGCTHACTGSPAPGFLA